MSRLRVGGRGFDPAPPPRTRGLNAVMVRKANNILELIGPTPIVRLNRLNPNPQVEIYVKLEYFSADTWLCSSNKGVAEKEYAGPPTKDDCCGFDIDD